MLFEPHHLSHAIAEALAQAPGPEKNQLKFSQIRKFFTILVILTN